MLLLLKCVSDVNVNVQMLVLQSPIWSPCRWMNIDQSTVVRKLLLRLCRGTKIFTV